MNDVKIYLSRISFRVYILLLTRSYVFFYDMCWGELVRKTNVQALVNQIPIKQIYQQRWILL